MSDPVQPPPLRRRSAPGIRSGLALLFFLSATHFAGELILGDSWQRIIEEKPGLQTRSLGDALSAGVLPGISGGLEHVAANVLWLRMYQHWAAREALETRALIATATTLDPRNFYFWRQGARILAYDLPVWEIRRVEASGTGLLSDRQIAAIREDGAAQAIRLLLRAEQIHPREPAVWIEIGQIHLHVRGDRLRAAEAFKRAAGMPGAPYFPGRLHAELLRSLGRAEEAYAFYRDWHPLLPEEDPGAAAAVVLGRIRDLEEELGVPAGERYGISPED